MKVRKKLPYYLIGVLAVFALSLIGPLRAIGEKNESISVIRAVIRLSRETLWESTAQDAFGACFSAWLYMLMPIVAAIPSASYIYEEVTSRFYMGVELRKGRYSYVYSRFLYSAVSGIVTVSAGLAVYAVFVCCMFPLNPVGDVAIVGYEAVSRTELVGYILLKILYIGLYGMAMSALASFLVYLYSNLYVDLSVLFIVSYLLRGMAMKGKFIFPLAVMAVMAVLYGIMWKIRSDRI